MMLRSSLTLSLALLLFPHASVAHATPPAEPAALEARIAALVGKAGGLTAEEVARRTVASSHDLTARAAEIEGAMSQVEQAFTNYFPRLTLLGRFTRLSPITLPNLIPPGTPFSGLNFTFPVLLNNWTFQAQLAIPISDYIFRINQGHRAATKSAKAATLSERAPPTTPGRARGCRSSSRSRRSRRPRAT
jgi:outer membrane protein TolC